MSGLYQCYLVSLVEGIEQLDFLQYKPVFCNLNKTFILCGAMVQLTTKVCEFDSHYLLGAWNF